MLLSLKQLFSGERSVALRPSCFCISYCVPERHIDLDCAICYKTMSTLSFKIIKEKEKTQKFYRTFQELVLWCLGPIEFRQPVII